MLTDLKKMISSLIPLFGILFVIVCFTILFLDMRECKIESSKYQFGDTVIVKNFPIDHNVGKVVSIDGFSSILVRIEGELLKFKHSSLEKIDK